jgi:hypothetical protein
MIHGGCPLFSFAMFYHENRGKFFISKKSYFEENMFKVYRIYV